MFDHWDPLIYLWSCHLYRKKLGSDWNTAHLGAAGGEWIFKQKTRNQYLFTMWQQSSFCLLSMTRSNSCLKLTFNCASPSGYSWSDSESGFVPCKSRTAEGAGSHPETGSAAGQSTPRHTEAHQHGRHTAAVCGKSFYKRTTTRKRSPTISRLSWWILTAKCLISGGSAHGGDCGGMHRSTAHSCQRCT